MRESNISNENNLSSNIKNSSIKNDIYSSIKFAMDNPIVLQLIEFGIDPKYSKRIFLFYHPLDIDDALDYLRTENGIIQHNFLQERNSGTSDICYLCGENKNIHSGSIPLNDSNINNNRFSVYSSLNEASSKNKEIEDSNVFKSKSINISLNSQKKDECPICQESFDINDNNRIKNCGHAFCNDCWYSFLSIKIQENRLTLIKCLEYDCQEKPDDDFIINLLNSNNSLIEKYKKFKLQLEVMNSPNKKLCPFPNCDSFLELKDINNKEVMCMKNHKFCFACLNEPHGNFPCKNKLDKSLIEFAKNILLKNCPNCSIITEKISGCNHITCIKCSYQWCWLCNEKYTSDHFQIGKCKGYQFFRPKNEDEIKLAFEGKIQLKGSQIQEIDENINQSEISENPDILENENNVNDIHVDIENDIQNSEMRNVHNNNNSSINSDNTLQEILNLNKSRKISMIFVYIFFGHFIISGNIFLQNWSNKIVLVTIFLIEIPFFFLQILINILMLIPYIMKEKFNSFIYQFYYNVRFKEDKLHRFHQTTKSIYYIILIMSMGSFIGALNAFFKYSNFTKKKKIALSIVVIFITFILSPLHLISNTYFLLYFILHNKCNLFYMIIEIRKFANYINNNI